MSESNNSSSVAARISRGQQVQIQSMPARRCGEIKIRIQADGGGSKLSSRRMKLLTTLARLTRQLPLLSLDHHLAIAYAAIPTVNAKREREMC
jgi:hypothetical protein